MTRQAEELFYCFYCKFSPWGFAESIIPCEVKEGCLLQKAITNPVTGRQMAPGKRSPWCQTSKGDNKKGKGMWVRSQSNQTQGYPGHWHRGKGDLKCTYKELCKEQKGQRLISLCLMPMLVIQTPSSQCSHLLAWGKSFGLHETLEYFSSILLLTFMKPAGTSGIRALHLSKAWLKLTEGGYGGCHFLRKPG